MHPDLKWQRAIKKCSGFCFNRLLKPSQCQCSTSGTKRIGPTELVPYKETMYRQTGGKNVIQSIAQKISKCKQSQGGSCCCCCCCWCIFVQHCLHTAFTHCLHTAFTHCPHTAYITHSPCYTLPTSHTTFVTRYLHYTSPTYVTYYLHYTHSALH